MTLDRSISVLLIEDDEIDIKAIKYGFAEFNIKNKLIVARTGVEALEKLCGLNGVKRFIPIPKVILLDINMPKMNGFELLQKLQDYKHCYSIPIIIITTSDSEYDKKTAQSFNVSGYFVKPVNFEEFIPIYKRIIES